MSFEVTKVDEPIKITQSSAGSYHNLALDESGNLYAWGSNEYGQLGDGTTTDIPITTLIMSGIKFKAVTAGYSSWNTLDETHILALDVEGNLYAWGSNTNAKLGDGTYKRRLTPILITNNNNFNSISAGAFHNLAINELGSLYSWGYNSYGQLGYYQEWYPIHINKYFP